MSSAAEVVILQHPLEVNNPKGSARLLHLSLRDSRLLIGEQFAADDAMGAQSRHTMLLYPALPTTAVDLPNSTLVPHPNLPAPDSVRLIVLDGTWRKSRKLLYSNPWLQALPRLVLRTVPRSRYVIRRAHRVDQLSTLEATCQALLELSEPAAPLAQLLEAFDGWVADLATRQRQTPIVRTR